MDQSRWTMESFSSSRMVDGVTANYNKVLRFLLYLPRAGADGVAVFSGGASDGGPPVAVRPREGAQVSFTRITDPKLADKFSNSLPPNPSAVTKAQCNCYDLGGIDKKCNTMAYSIAMKGHWCSGSGHGNSKKQAMLIKKVEMING
ncbi:unnamed protein product [Miscanthus lutarioriparius]|uniref:Uncharacterized protein n=1 Tax=Miscanthus lutarioriparius TaxID=422564 RepID=A0A811PPH1_9POAL|nr:unnamed protein product [Miscanthus lutarioriparius]